MTGRSTKRVTRGLLTSMLGAAACFAPGGELAGAAEVTVFPSGTAVIFPPAERPAVFDATAGMTIYIDPQTGAILNAPAPGSVPLQLTPQERAALSTSDQGLVSVPSAVPGGGVKVDLQGRFQSPLAATVGANGKVKLLHFGETPGSHDDH